MNDCLGGPLDIESPGGPEEPPPGGSGQPGGPPLGDPGG